MLVLVHTSTMMSRVMDYVKGILSNFLNCYITSTPLNMRKRNTKL